MDKNSVNKDSEEKDERHKIEVVDDTNPDFITADSELTQDLPDDVEVIDLVHLKIKSLEDLNLYRFKNLKQLCLRQNLIESISEVEVLPHDKIVDLDFYDNKIKHISSNVNKLTKLTSLDLSFNKIKHIKNLENLTDLENLYFVQNSISKIENLSTLKSLKNLELGGNKVHSIEPDSFEGLSNLEEIWLGKNSIPRLINLHPLKNLKILSIQSNKLKKNWKSRRVDQSWRALSVTQFHHQDWRSREKPQTNYFGRDLQQNYLPGKLEPPVKFNWHMGLL